MSPYFGTKEEFMEPEFMQTTMVESTPSIPKQCEKIQGVDDYQNLSKTQKKKKRAKYNKDKNASAIKIFEINEVDMIKSTSKFNKEKDASEIKSFEVNEAESMNNTSKNKEVNLFKQQFTMLDQKPSIKISFEDSLVKGIQEVIDEHLGHVSLSDDDILSVIKKVNDKKAKD